eukprot:SAG31_NODE_20_length_34168_cov_33.651296_14_plen_85_part_00
MNDLELTIESITVPVGRSTLTYDSWGGGGGERQSTEARAQILNLRYLLKVLINLVIDSSIHRNGHHTRGNIRGTSTGTFCTKFS